VPSVSPSPEPRAPVIGQYELLAKLGSGGSGMVFRARHTGLKRTVALKVLSPHHAHLTDAVGRFRVEMAALGRLTHPHVARATDAGEADGYYYLAMEYVDGADLGRVLKHHGRLAVPDACEAVRQAADALAFIHAHGMVHRDLKPSNLLLGRDGLVRVLDLGLARFREPPTGGGPLTVTGAVMGTADFIAPEQARDSRDVDIRADVYSLGCTLFALLAGDPPFGGPAFDTVYRKFKAHNETAPPTVRSLTPAVPDELDRLVAWMLEKDPARRPQEPEELARLLAPFCAGSRLGGLAAEVADPPADAVTLAAGLPTPLAFLAGVPGDPAAPGTATRSLSEEASGHTTVSISAPARRPRRWALPVAAILLLLGLTAWVIWVVSHRENRGNEQAPEPPAPPPPEPAPSPSAGPVPRAFKPGEWTEMLDRPPVKRVWPADDARCSVAVDAGGHRVRVECTDLGVLDLGVVDAPAYDAEVRVFQTGWTAGRVGVFVRGGDPAGTSALGRIATLARDPEAAAYSWLADTLFLNTLPPWQPDGTARGQLDQGRLGTLAATGLLRSAGRFRLLVDHPNNREVVLTLTVTDRGLDQITWGGAAAQLVTERPPLPVRSARGGVGVFVLQSSAQFRSFRVRPHSPESRGSRP
jgi:hypothetical protein